MTICFLAGHHQEKSLVQTLNKALREQEQLKAYYEMTQYTLSNGSAASYRKSPEFHDSQGRTIFWCNQDDVKYIEMNRELTFMLGLAVHAKHGPKHIPILENAHFGSTKIFIFLVHPVVAYFVISCIWTSLNFRSLGIKHLHCYILFL